VVSPDRSAIVAKACPPPRAVVASIPSRSGAWARASGPRVAGWMYGDAAPAVRPRTSARLACPRSDQRSWTRARPRWAGSPPAPRSRPSVGRDAPDLTVAARKARSGTWACSSGRDFDAGASSCTVTAGAATGGAATGDSGDSTLGGAGGAGAVAGPLGVAADSGATGVPSRVSGGPTGAASRGGKNSSGSRYPCGSSVRRTPR
jgi:hypothetical protein